MHPFSRISHALAKRPVQKCNKNQPYFNDFENAMFVSISVFFIPRGPKGPSETPFGERSGDFGVPSTPLEIGEGPPWAAWAAPRAPFRLTDIGPWRKKAGPSQHKKTHFHTGKTILFVMFSFDTPPANRSYSFLTLFFVFSSASWPLFFYVFTSSHFSISILSWASAREVRPGLPFLVFLGPLDATGAIQALKTV